jgi:hypothetical protein
MERGIADGVEITCRFTVDGALANVALESAFIQHETGITLVTAQIEFIAQDSVLSRAGVSAGCGRLCDRTGSPVIGWLLAARLGWMPQLDR